jgi:tetratricopeptide (TPR) repeat protein
MLKRSLIIISLSLMLVLVAEPIRSVHGIVIKADEVNTATERDRSTEKSGNSFFRTLKAPFRAIGRLFGAGKKDEKLHRLSEKDTKKFESTGLLRVVDARIAPTPAAPANENVSPAPTNAPTNTSADATVNEALALEHLNAGRTFLNNGQLNEAISELSSAASLNPKLSEAHNLLGVAYEKKGMRDRALKSFEVALRTDHDNPEHLNNMGYVLFKNGDYDAAAKYLKRAVKLAPDRQRYWNNLGLVQAQRGKFDDAYSCFKRAVGEFEAHMSVASRLQAMGYDKDAVKHLEAARAIQPNVALILVKLTNLYNRLGQTEQAEEARRSLAAVQSLANVATPNQ